jgi:hypothetical protein
MDENRGRYQAHPIFGELLAETPKTSLHGGEAAAGATDAAVIVNDLPVLRAGFIAGQVTHRDSKFLLVFADRDPSTWMLVPIGAVKGVNHGKDEETPDEIWIERHAEVYVGTQRPRAVESMFVTGSLTSADTIDQTLGSRGGGDVGLFSPNSPPLCGCGRKTP